MALIGTSTVQVPGITEEPQTGGGTPIQEGTQLVPFKLEEPDYSITNIKKVFETFPSSLRTKQLTSLELLDFLENEIGDRDEQIQELLRLLEQLVNEGTGLGNVSGQLANFATNLEGTLNSLITDTLNETETDAEAAALRGQEYKQAGRNLFIKVETDLNIDSRFQGYDFAHNNNDEQGGSGSRITINPSKVLFRNTGTSNITVQKLEDYQEPPTSVESGDKFNRSYTRYSDPSIVNTFKHDGFNSFGGQHTFEIPAGEEISVNVAGEKAKSIVGNFGLRLGSDDGKNAIAHTGNLIYKNVTEGGEASFTMYYERDKD